MTFPFSARLRLLKKPLPLPVAPPAPPALWDYLIGPDGRKPAWLCDLNDQGCVLRTSEPLDTRRWLRIAYEGADGLTRMRTGKTVRREDRLESVGDAASPRVTLHRYSIVFESGALPDAT